MPTSTCCDGIVLTDEYHFCPRCGRRSGRLAALAIAPIKLEPDETEFSLVLRNSGPGPLPYRVTVTGPHLELPGQSTGELAGGVERSLRVRLQSGAPDAFQSAVTVWPRDKARPHWWQKDEEREVPVPLTVERRRAARLEVPAKILLFGKNAPTQSLYIHNGGDTPAPAILQAPVGYTVTDAEGRTGTAALPLSVPANGWAQAWVTREKRAAADPQTLAISGDGAHIAVELRPLQPSGQGGFRPDHVVGIDFGTRNTSLRWRRVDNNQVKDIGPQRFPSVLFVNPVLPKDPLIGEAAEGAWNDPTQPDDAFLVESIKTLVRLDQEPYVESHGPDWTVANLLRLYLTALRQMIHKELAKNDVQDENNVLYVFTLPVLDAGTLYDRQEKRMRAASAAAGFPDDDELVWMIPEPYAAALRVAHSLPELAERGVIPTGIRPGARLCVVDAGGGTTDVCLGALQLDKAGRWIFQTEQTGALQKKQGQASSHFMGLLYPSDSTRRIAPRDAEVGGNAIDYEIAYRSIPEGSHKIKAFPAAVWNILYPDMADAQSIPLRAAGFLHGITSLKHDLSDHPADPVDLRTETEVDGIPEYEYKRRFVNTTIALDVLFKDCNPVFTYNEAIKPVLADLWEQETVGPYLTQMLTAVGGCELIVPVGGTTLIPEFLQQLRRWTSADLIELTPDERMTAVADGAVWAYDARLDNTLPLDLTLQVQDETHGQDAAHNGRRLLHAFQPLAGMAAFGRRYEIGDSQTFPLMLHASHQDPTKPDFPALTLAAFSFSGPAESAVRLQAIREGGVLFRLELTTDGRRLPVWEVRL